MFDNITEATRYSKELIGRVFSMKKGVDPASFRLGVDSIPDWFWDQVNTNAIILHGETWGPLESCSGLVNKQRGDVVTRLDVVRSIADRIRNGI